MNSFMMLFGLLCLGGARMSVACSKSEGGSNSLQELQDSCQACVGVEATDMVIPDSEETQIEGIETRQFETELFKNEKDFRCLNDVCSSNEDCFHCLTGKETNSTVCGQSAIKVCTTSIKEVRHKKGSLDDKDYYTEADKTNFYNIASGCMVEGADNRDKTTKCVVDMCNDDYKCFPCLMRVKMYCGAYGDEINECVQNKFITKCVNLGKSHHG